MRVNFGVIICFGVDDSFIIFFIVTSPSALSMWYTHVPSFPGFVLRRAYLHGGLRCRNPRRSPLADLDEWKMSTSIRAIKRLGLGALAY